MTRTRTRICFDKGGLLGVICFGGCWDGAVGGFHLLMWRLLYILSTPTIAKDRQKIPWIRFHSLILTICHKELWPWKSRMKLHNDAPLISKLRMKHHNDAPLILKLRMKHTKMRLWIQNVADSKSVGHILSEICDKYRFRIRLSFIFANQNNLD